ncbi:MAG: hemin uptake protein HemP [Rhodocyclaceae bacterium]|jgi:hemin uptake protein HemP|nr:hemin uptake protein HemP [Rhodocyclaceae bacterium]MCL4757815.1 hemin uptake protein HemP [Rhodocyclaceae bacterium]
MTSKPPSIPASAAPSGRTGTTNAISPAQTPCLSSAALLGGHSSIAIDHEGTRYVLRATRTGKLILTK